MPKINCLSSEVYNKISAGEVIERPASVVKELIENSIDANATSISIDIIDGGLKSILIIDNGCGMELDDLRLAFLPHSTSKLTTSDDLDNIATLGFRGEALASIAAVSIVEITSRAADSDLGNKLCLSNGKIEQETTVSSNIGTRLLIQDLFYNTPARKKFLKKNTSESKEIIDIVARLMLANSCISFKLTIDEQLIYSSQGKGIEEAIFIIYGLKYLENSIKIEYNYNGMKISGYVSNPSFTKPNSTYQTLIINGRFVLNATISAAIKQAYQPYLMTRNYPFYVLFLTIDTSQIDVNVHPNKLDIRFSDNNSIFTIFFRAIKNALDQFIKSNITKITENNLPNSYIDTKITDNIITTSQDKERNSINIDDYFSNSMSNIDNNKINYNNQIQTEQTGVIDMSKNSFTYEIPLNIPTFDKTYNDMSLMQPQTTTFINEVAFELSYVGCLFDTYLIFTTGQSVYLVDFHAAHERILFDKLMETNKSNNSISQDLLIPYIFDTNNQESQLLTEHLSTFTLSGFDIRIIGINSYAIYAIPQIISSMNLQQFVESILGDIFANKELDTFNTEKLIRTACRAAAKSGDKLNSSDIDYIKQKLSLNINLKCPHGRPLAIEISKLQLDKMFKRII